jgi:hypothetical protein
VAADHGEGVGPAAHRSRIPEEHPMKIRPISAILALVAACVLILQAGCTPTRTAQENAWLVDRVLERESKMLVDDIGHFWLLEHPSRLTSWHALN